MYLLCRLLEGRRAGGYRVCAAHYNHNLRCAAAADEQFVRDWCGAHEIPLLVGSGDVAGEARRSGDGLEARGRAMRYAFLEEAAEELDCQLIATGHHAGDNAETVLLHLVRGCGLQGLTGIPERRGRLIRPMLAITRGEILAYLNEHAVPHVEDESNSDPAYTRNFLRTRVMPLLEQVNPRAVEHMAAAAARLARDERELTRQAEELARQAAPEGDGLAIAAAVLASAADPVALRAVGMLLDRAGLDGTAVHREGVLALSRGTDPSARLDVGGGRVFRNYELLCFSPERAAEAPPELPLGEGTRRWGAWRITAVRSTCPPKAYVSPEEFHIRPGGLPNPSPPGGGRAPAGAAAREKFEETDDRAARPPGRAPERAGAGPGGPGGGSGRVRPGPGRPGAARGAKPAHHHEKGRIERASGCGEDPVQPGAASGACPGAGSADHQRLRGEGSGGGRHSPGVIRFYGRSHPGH